MSEIVEYSAEDRSPRECLLILEEELGSLQRELDSKGRYSRDGLVIRKSEGFIPSGEIAAGLASRPGERIGTTFAYNPEELDHETVNRIEKWNGEEIEELVENAGDRPWG